MSKDKGSNRAAPAAATLRRSLKPRHVTMITLGGIIGAGLFVGSSVSITAAGPAVVLSYALAGAIVLLVMRMLAEMAVAHPEIRSFTEFARAGLGAGAGFVAGWLYWYFWVVVIPVEGIAGAALVHAWLPLPAWLTGLGLMVGMTGINLLSARAYGEFEFWFASIKISAIIVFLTIATSYCLGLGTAHGAVLSNFWRHGGFAPHGVWAMLAAVVTVFFSINGAEIATIAAAESTEPSRAVAQMTVSIVWRILIFYVGSIFLIVAVVPWDLVRPGESPFTLALRQMNVHWAASVMNAIILTAVLSCLNSAFYVCSRVLFVLATHGDAPRWLVKLSARGVPARSVLACGLAGVLGIVANMLAPKAVFAFLVNASGAIMLIAYILISLAQVRLRRERQRAGLAEPTSQMWLFPWLSYVAIAAMSAALIAMGFTSALKSQLYFSLLAAALAVGVYGLRKHRRLRYVHSASTNI